VAKIFAIKSAAIVKDEGDEGDEGDEEDFASSSPPAPSSPQNQVEGFGAFCALG